MPQLDFTWWIINFIIIWVAVIAVLTVILANSTSPNVDQLSSSPNIKKETTTWQWL